MNFLVWHWGSFQLVTSPALLDELDEKLQFKFSVSSKDARFIRARLEQVAIVVTPQTILDVVHDDPDDDRVLECAASIATNFIVRGDRHLLQLKSFQGIPILTIRQFMDGPGAKMHPPLD